MPESEESQVHPLDRDYSEPIVTARQRLTGHRKVRRFGQIVFGGGCLSLLPAAAIATSFPATWIESFASSVHRLGMFGILIGGLIIIASYRIENLEEAAAERKRQYRVPRDW